MGELENKIHNNTILTQLPFAEGDLQLLYWNTGKAIRNSNRPENTIFSDTASDSIDIFVTSASLIIF